MARSTPHPLRGSPYRPVLAHPVLRRLLPGYAISSIGDGMAVVAVGWLAVELAPADARGVWVALAAAAYTLPGALGAVVLNRLLRGRNPARLATWDALLRATALGAIPVAHVAGALSIGLCVALLAMSSVLHSWGQAGTYTLLARQLRERDHLAGNALFSTIGSVSSVAGPLLSAAMVVWTGAIGVIAVDAASFAILAGTLLVAAPGADSGVGAAEATGTDGAGAAETAGTGGAGVAETAGTGEAGPAETAGTAGAGVAETAGTAGAGPAETAGTAGAGPAETAGTAGAADAEDPERMPVEGASRAGGVAVIRADPTMRNLVLLTIGFFFLFGPVYVALPLHVTQDLHASAGTLAGFYSLFGAGAVLGSLLAGYLRRLPLARAAAGIVTLSGLTLLPVGLGAPTWAAMAGFALLGFLWPPFSTMSTTLFQHSSTPAQLPQVLAVVSAIRILAVPLGTALGGPSVATLGPEPTLLISASGILTLGLITVTALPRHLNNHPSQPGPSGA
ncbi:MFS transporter [Streptomyces sp. SID3343]|uniref:MFS transporter n=1 Tax=Streptomyces sp. SID3343 TaxID=2690260 RepID=UPI001367F1AE|nr:MFS transporter [Streptomyces sp. SID3343]MYW05386.1 MFS transporter [Streptomyces sp. SID3343]